MPAPSHDKSKIEQAIEDLLPAQTQYVANKHQGGNNGLKGANYEDYFASFLIAKTAGKYLDQDRQISGRIEGQRYGFVDDLYLEDETTQCYYQLKDSTRVLWGKISNSKSIASDFKNQAIIAGNISKKSLATILVCSDKKIAQRRGKKIPPEIAAHTKVEHFPCPTDGSASAEKLLMCNQDLRQSLAKLSRTACDSDISELAATLITIKGIWSSQEGGPHDLSIIYNKCLDQNPRSCRPLTKDADLETKLQPRFKEILGSIQGLNYVIVNGFFNWKCGNDSGTYPHSCNDRAFEHFQAAIIQRAPSTFDELEEELT